MSIFKKDKQHLIIESKKPTHIAFIIDGNGRWAKKRGFPRTTGHKFGVEAVGNTIKNCLELGIKYISFYTFSTENWNRPKEEIDAIFELLREYIEKDTKDYEKNNIKFVTSGDLKKLPKDITAEIEKAKEKTKNNTAMVVNMAINYGGRDEIILAVNNIIKEGKTEVDKESFKNYLYTANMPDPDLIIRTSGEMRTSNFMPYQAVYSEWYFPKTYWPDFNKSSLVEAILNYQKRNRRFGVIKRKR
jgi:undecaprenyl diphosphate synthase